MAAAAAYSWNDNNGPCFELFCLLWLDSNPDESQDTEQKLRSVINHLEKYQNIPQCQRYIRQTSIADRVVLITSGRLGREIVPTIHHLRQIISIYIYCMDKKANEQWSSNFSKVNDLLFLCESICRKASFSKVKGVFTTIDELIDQIRENHRIEKQIEEPLAINIFSVGHGQSTSGLNGNFVFSQILIDCLLRLKSTDRDREELIEVLKHQYQENQVELNHIIQFQNQYQSNKALRWYTKESFFHKTLNTVLRTENLHMIFLFRSYILDIQQQLQSCQSKEFITVYRAQLISKEELNHLKRSIGQFISINSFFSTSVDFCRALSFFALSHRTENTEKIVFEIEADPNLGRTKPFANISQFSTYSEEDEVLFMIGSIFRLKKVSFDKKNKIWLIEMVSSSDEDIELKQVLTHMKQQIGCGETNLRVLAKFLSKMGQFQLAGKYLERLLKELSKNDPLVGHLYADLGKIASQSGQFDQSIEWHRREIAFQEQTKLPSTVKSANKKLVAQPSLKKIIKWKQHAITVAGGHGEGNQLNQLSSPIGIYIDDDEQEIYVADCWNDRVVKWKFGAQQGEILAGGNGRGDRIDQLNRPTDVVLDKTTRSLIICDRENRRIVRWSMTNAQDQQILVSDVDCRGLVINKNGDLFACDSKRHVVRRWGKGDSSGTIVAGGNERGNHFNQLHYPRGVFVNKYETVYVSDCSNHRVMKWKKGAKEGIVVAGGQSEGSGSRQFSSPMGMCVNDARDVYVADCLNHRVMCWPSGSKEGRLLVGGNGKGTESDQLNCPNSLLFDRKNNLYVVDWGNHRVQRFDVDPS